MPVNPMNTVLSQLLQQAAVREGQERQLAANQRAQARDDWRYSQEQQRYGMDFLAKRLDADRKAYLDFTQQAGARAQAEGKEVPQYDQDIYNAAAQGGADTYAQAYRALQDKQKGQMALEGFQAALAGPKAYAQAQGKAQSKIDQFGAPSYAAALTAEKRAGMLPEELALKEKRFDIAEQELGISKQRLKILEKELQYMPLDQKIKVFNALGPHAVFLFEDAAADLQRAVGSSPTMSGETRGSGGGGGTGSNPNDEVYGAEYDKVTGSR